VFWELLSEHLIVQHLVELLLNLPHHLLLDLVVVTLAYMRVNPATDYVLLGLAGRVALRLRARARASQRFFLTVIAVLKRAEAFPMKLASSQRLQISLYIKPDLREQSQAQLNF
jgi:hypothetical protein